MKRGIDQTTSWIFALALTGAVFSGGYFLTKYSAGSGKTEYGEEDADVKPAVADSPEAALDHAAANGHDGVDWTYAGSSGPDHWATLADAFTACATGTQQSPVDISGAHRSTKLLPIKFHYHASEMVFKNNGHTVQADVHTGNYVEIDGERFELLELQFHSPSEHKVEGIPYDMELQFVHKNAAGRLVMIAVFFQEGHENAALKPLWDHMPRAAGAEKPGLEIDPAMLLPGSTSYFYYTGSLTTPPCSEGVRWYVLKQPVEASAKQVDSLVSAVKFNARPVQQLHERRIEASTR